MRKITDRMAVLSLSLLVAFSVASCAEDYDMVEPGDMNAVQTNVPENWVTVSNEPLTIGYEGGDLELDYTLASGLCPKVVYVVNSEEWCKGYVQDGKLKAVVGMSDAVHGRSAKMFLTYDSNHKVELTLNQGKAPVKSVTGFDFSQLETIKMDEEVDLNTVISVLPLDASFKQLTFELVEGEDVVSLTAEGVAKGLYAGTAVIRVTATSDDEVVGAGISEVFQLKVKGEIVYKRDAWTVTTPEGLPYTPDGSTGKPEDLFDDNNNTFLSLQKPDRGNNPNKITPAFTIDMKSEIVFNYFYLAHRGNNATNGLRLRGVELFGSHDGENFESIGVTAIDTGGNLNYSIPESKYRYLRVVYTDWNHDQSMAIQVAEFALGRIIE